MHATQGDPFLLFFQSKRNRSEIKTQSMVRSIDAKSQPPQTLFGSWHSPAPDDEMRIGIFGGSFDPIHIGHLILAEHCRQQASLDQVLFIPSAQGPHKEDGPVGTDRQRVEMVDLAIGGHPAFLRSSIEIDRGGISYTVDTLEQLKQQHPDDELFLLIGGDSLNNFHTWKDPKKILTLATPLVMARPGEGDVNFDLLVDYVDSETLAAIKSMAITAPLIDISSTSIRAAASDEASFRYQTPRSVERYIQTQKVYQKRKSS